jgi:glycosyltransferase involved in cell wall biosynthesis
VFDIGYLIRSYLTGRPFLIERDDLLSMQEVVNRLIRDGDFHFLHADQLTMVQFAIRGAPVAVENKPKIIFDAHNAVWTIVKRMRDNAPWFLKPVLAVEAKRVKQYEGELLRKVDHVLAVTDIDQKLMQDALTISDAYREDRIAPITVIPIAVDTGKLQPVDRKKESKNIITLGTLHYPPNADGIRWFINEVFSLILERMPDVTLTIIGKNPPRDFLDLASRNPKSVIVTGYVNDLVPYLEDSALMVVPVRAGGGMRVLILEAFAYAVPVVTTTVGLEGIHAIPERDVQVADTPVDFADRTVELLNNVSMQDKLAENGRKLAETQYDWHVVLSALRSIYG